MSIKTKASIVALVGALALTGVACGADDTADSNASGAAQSTQGGDKVTAIPSPSSSARFTRPTGTTTAFRSTCCSRR